MFEQFYRSRAEKEEASRSVSFTSAAIYQAAQVLEEVGKPVDFIKYDEFIAMLRQIKFWFAQFRAVCIRFKIQIERWAGFSDFKGKGCFANLTRPNERDSRGAIDQVFQLCSNPTLNHPCIYGI